MTTGATAPSVPTTVRLNAIPQLAQEGEIRLLESLLEDPRRAFEQKLDGDRVLACLDEDGNMTFLNRNGQPYTKGVPRALREFRLPAGAWIFDGELVGGTYWVFDLILTPSEEVTNGPLHLRRHALEAIYAAGSLWPMRLVPQAKETYEKRLLAEQVVAMNGEGLMVKRLDSPYQQGGRTTAWLKIKFTKTADVVVIPKTKKDGHNSVALGMYIKGTHGVSHDPVPVGAASLNGKEKREVINVGDVLEVKYLYTGANGRLYQPRILRKRSDKRPEECTTDQLVYVNKQVLEAIE